MAGPPLAFRPDGDELASGGVDGTVRLWDTRTWQERQVVKGHSGQVIAYRPDGRVLASGDGRGLWAGVRDRTIRLWDVATARAVWTIAAHDDYITALAFVPTASGSPRAVTTARSGSGMLTRGRGCSRSTIRSTGLARRWRTAPTAAG